jgi:cell division protein FtsQ
VNDRFTARQLDLRRHKWFRIAVVALLAVLLGALVWLVWFSSVLDVRSVAVKGETSLTSEQVREAAKVPIGGPVARLDLTAIEARVKVNPRVRLVDVSRSWPHGVTIEVTERSAVIWLTAGGEFRGVDQFGVNFRSYRKKPTDLIAAEVLTSDPARRLETLRAVAAIAERIQRDDPTLRKQVQAVTAATKDSVTLDLTKGRTVTWGSESQGARKLEVLRTLLSIDAKGYDVSAPDQPTTRK